MNPATCFSIWCTAAIVLTPAHQIGKLQDRLPQEIGVKAERLVPAYKRIEPPPTPGSIAELVYRLKHR